MRRNSEFELSTRGVDSSGQDGHYSGYDEVLKTILGETYQDELIGFLRQSGFINDGHVPQLRLPPDRHDGSSALYLFDFYHEHEGEQGERDRIFVSLMGPGEKTSKHFHREPIFEEYHVLKGKLYLNLDDLNGAFIPPEGLIVPPGVLHQAETRDRYSLTLIIMRNAGLVPENQQHIRPRLIIPQ